MSARPIAALLKRASDVSAARTIAVVADRHLSVAALVALLLRDPAVQWIGEVEGTVDVISTLLSWRPDVVVLECSTGRWQRRIDPGAWGGRLLQLFDPEGDDLEVATPRPRAGGYLSRGASRDALLTAIVGLGGTVSSPPDGQTAGLSRRQREILVQVARGKSSKEIARDFRISSKTVGNHVNHLYRKLQLSHRGELVLYAARAGLTDRS
jgi:DNA-binding NarL/FixJ family response regulator